VDELMGGRFWPAVVEYFRRRHGLDVLAQTPISNRICILPFKPDSY
jgi:hypothetical protein